MCDSLVERHNEISVLRYDTLMMMMIVMTDTPIVYMRIFSLSLSLCEMSATTTTKLFVNIVNCKQRRATNKKKISAQTKTDTGKSDRTFRLCAEFSLRIELNFQDASNGQIYVVYFVREFF